MPFLFLIASALTVQATGTDTVRQRDLLDLAASVLGRPVSVSDTLAIENRLTLTLLPSISANPATGVSFGISGNGAIRFGPPIITTISTFGLSANYTTKGQLNLMLRSSAYGRANHMKSEGDWRYLDTNQPTYGLGSAQPGSQKSPMDFQLVRLYETVYLEAVPNILLGVGYHLDWHFGIVDQNATQGILTPYLAYNGGTTVTETISSGLSFNILTDSRDNPINASRGAYAWASLRLFPTWLGSDQSWQSLQADFRVYPWLGTSGKQLLAIWSSMWLSFGQAPYLDLPAIGWDYSNRSGRGYAQGRIRAHDLVYSEVEYRHTLTADGLIGAAVFMNFTSASDPVTGALNPPNIGAGAGLRLKLNKRSDTNITIDFGFGAQGSNGLFLGSAEAF